MVGLITDDEPTIEEVEARDALRDFMIARTMPLLEMHIQLRQFIGQDAGKTSECLPNIPDIQPVSNDYSGVGILSLLNNGTLLCVMLTVRDITFFATIGLA